MNLTIGILLPRADMYPTLALDFLNGIKLKTEEFSPSPKLVIEGIGNASDDTVINMAEKLILQENVDLVISFCGYIKLQKLIKTFETYKKPLLHIDLGGNILTKNLISPYVFHHSLNLSMAAYISGCYAAKNYGKKVAYCSSFYDGGYQLVISFDTGFTEHGGETVYHYVSPHEYESESFDNMIEGLEASKPDVIFCVFSYKEGNKVLDKLSKSALNGTVPILSTPILTDESYVETNYQIENLHSIASWSFDDALDAMKTFNEDYKKQYDTAPNLFSLLGFECGLIIQACLDQHQAIPAKIGKQLMALSLETPRGKLGVNKYYESVPEHFKLREFQYNKTTYHNTVVESLPATQQLNEKFEGQLFSGWLNPYICT